VLLSVTTEPATRLCCADIGELSAKIALFWDPLAAAVANLVSILGLQFTFAFIFLSVDPCFAPQATSVFRGDIDLVKGLLLGGLPWTAIAAMRGTLVESASGEVARLLSLPNSANVIVFQGFSGSILVNLVERLIP
jgi:hypothetical protein